MTGHRRRRPTGMIDLGPATSRLATLVSALGDDDLARPTPCDASSVGDLLDHLDSFCTAFIAAATKTPIDRAPTADGTRLGDDWRTRIPDRLAELAAAWRQPDAWRGTTRAGGVDLPGDVCGVVALDEVLIHGWDIARATGNPWAMPDDEVAAALGWVREVAADGAGTPGLFGPAVAVGDAALLAEQLLGLTGRDPRWSAPPR